MKFDFLFNSFSQRGKLKEPFVYKITDGFRNKMFLWCEETFSNRENAHRTGNYLDAYWEEIHRMLLYQQGRQFLADFRLPTNTDSKVFLLTCKDEEFINFIEYTFQVKCLSNISGKENELIAQVNQLLASERLGYMLTDMIKESQLQKTFYGSQQCIVVTAWPQVIRIDDQAIHETAIKPVLHFLSDPAYKSANLEYLDALDDYRKEDWGDSLTKCCSAFESVMKIICDKKKWKYSQDDTAKPLVKAIISNANIESHFYGPLMSIATLRHKHSKSHGAGTQPKKVTRSIALFGLNLTASAILFIIAETK